jgi:hypothetical protein
MIGRLTHLRLTKIHFSGMWQCNRTGHRRLLPRIGLPLYLQGSPSGSSCDDKMPCMVVEAVSYSRPPFSLRIPTGRSAKGQRA